MNKLVCGAIPGIYGQYFEPGNWNAGETPTNMSSANTITNTAAGNSYCDANYSDFVENTACRDSHYEIWCRPGFVAKNDCGDYNGNQTDCDNQGVYCNFGTPHKGTCDMVQYNLQVSCLKDGSWEGPTTCENIVDSNDTPIRCSPVSVANSSNCSPTGNGILGGPVSVL